MAEPITPTQALRTLADLGASPWLIRHHELVLEAAIQLCDLLRRDLDLRFERDHVLVGAAIHDAGKIVHPEEMREPGSRHERAGERLLVEHGFPAAMARFCITHASWNGPGTVIEDLLVALADKLWKGKRDDELEHLVGERIARETRRQPWEIFDALDSICEAIAADGETRLERSVT